MKIKDDVTYSSTKKESNDSYKKVKGPSKGATIGLIIAFSVIGGYISLPISLAGFLDTVLLKSQHVKLEELINVEGVVESVEVIGHEYGPTAEIKLKDDEKTFYMFDLVYQACDKSIKTDNLYGSLAYLSIDGSNNIYSFKTNEKVYLTYDGYLNKHKKDLVWRYGFDAAFGVIGSACLVGVILSAIHLKRIKQKKTSDALNVAKS